MRSESNEVYWNSFLKKMNRIVGSRERHYRAEKLPHRVSSAGSWQRRELLRFRSDRINLADIKVKILRTHRN